MVSLVEAAGLQAVVFLLVVVGHETCLQGSLPPSQTLVDGPASFVLLLLE